MTENISTFAELLSPMSPSEFIGFYVKQAPVFIRGGTPGRAGKLIDVRDVSELIQHGLHPEGRVCMFQNGQQIPAEFYSTRGENPRINASLVRRLLNGGASLIVNGIDEANAKVGNLVHAMELELSSNVWANAYVTAKEGDGAFKVHFDDHDVIVLQISGAKRWFLFGRTEEFPLHPGRSMGEPPTIEQDVDVLSAGEVLFIPRGVWHRAEAVESPSFHLTFGIGGVTGIDFIKSATDELRKDSLFRQYLPRSASIEKEHEKRLKSHLHDWVDRLSTKAFLDSIDSMRRNRSRTMLWGQIPINGTTRLSIALRRLQLDVLLKGAQDGKSPMGGEMHDVGPTACLILKVVFERKLVDFDELTKVVRATGNLAGVGELSSVVRELVETGLLNIQDP